MQKHSSVVYFFYFLEHISIKEATSTAYEELDVENSYGWMLGWVIDMGKQSSFSLLLLYEGTSNQIAQVVNRTMDWF